ncbi:hypothetical protein [Persicitalea jodogahamensis]|uniref:hypothetical protein n=1 Tax=Persicitalea jodogahamensis TaxID=402147 RepID=UPI001E58200A|nr:hypothetical protein [Persicitalea jodogahamensis]
MDSKVQTWLLDIDQSIDKIFEFLGDKRDFSDYKRDLKQRRRSRGIWKLSVKQ